MIYIASDHGGLALKAAAVKMLEQKGYHVTDLGARSEQSVDYPDYAFAVAERVAAEDGARGIVICRTGVGMSIAANKVKGIRCALCVNTAMSALCREHNNANVLALGASNTDIPTALDIINVFITTDFSGGRHGTRVGKIIRYEEQHG